jgi:hypothetical protein
MARIVCFIGENLGQTLALAFNHFFVRLFVKSVEFEMAERQRISSRVMVRSFMRFLFFIITSKEAGSCVLSFCSQITRFDF